MNVDDGNIIDSRGFGFEGSSLRIIDDQICIVLKSTIQLNACICVDRSVEAISKLMCEDGRLSGPVHPW